MATIQLSDRDRFAIYVHLNVQALTNHAEQRRMSRLWTVLDLDPIAAICEPRKDPVRTTEFSEEKKDYDITSDQRDYLIELLGRIMGAGLSRLLLPISMALMKSRDGETAA
jgi:hypothetical protein